MLAYKWCIVPECTNTSIKTPDKVFLSVPSDEKRKKTWFQIIRRDYRSVKPSSVLFICEDHFNLEEDLENYMRWKLTNSKKILKKNAVPSKFDCQKDRKRAFTGKPRSFLSKKKKQELIEEAFRTDVLKSTNVRVEEEIKEHLTDEIPGPSTSFQNLEKDLTEDILELPQKPSIKSVSDKSVTAKPYFRSKYVQTSMEMVSKGCSPIKLLVSDAFTSPLRISVVSKQKSLMNTTEESSEQESSFYAPSNVSSSDYEKENINKQFYSQRAIAHTHRIVTENPKVYIGVPKECLFIIQNIQKYTQLNVNCIYLTLQKIRLSQTFKVLADAYGVTESTASRMYAKSVVLISQLMQEFIINPKKKEIQEQLPIPFRARYSKVQTIIDCLEIEIQKPSDAVKQALTWSNYKKANTIKYLVGATPDGLITFVSTGFGGRTSDTVIVEKSRFLDKLEEGSIIMADRGFKHVENLFIQKNCTLLRPPSVKSGEKLSKTQVLEAKRIASLRIHIERVIRRLREFKFLQPHACVHNKLIGTMDDVLLIACGLTNIQGPLIKQ
ncbi:hypothetical protein FQR65_LT14461 [Abscondita terminalis]|nr:hypothetical protein FQR65_LT14461 [Abscondita terminalis]